MHRIPATALLAALLALAPTAVRAAAPSAAGAVAGDTVPAHALRAHIRFLADDLLEGRDPGTRGGEMAAHYIATQFERAGLQPLQGRRYQPVPLVGTTVEPASVVLSFTAADVPDPVVAGYPD